MAALKTACLTTRSVCLTVAVAVAVGGADVLPPATHLVKVLEVARSVSICTVVPVKQVN